MSFASRIVLAILLTATAVAQQTISVRAGLISHAEGWVYLDERHLHFIGNRSPEFTAYELEDDSTLRTSLGRVEIQLGAGAVLRMDRNGMLRMENSSLTNMRLLLEYGSVLVEIFERVKNNRISVRFGDALTDFKSTGLYRLNGNEPELRVYNGKAEIHLGDKKQTVKRGKSIDLLSLSVSKFETEPIDSFHRWAAQRSFDHFNMNQQSRRRLKNWIPLFGGWMQSLNYGVKIYSPQDYGATVSQYNRANRDGLERQRQLDLERQMEEQQRMETQQPVR